MKMNKRRFAAMALAAVMAMTAMPYSAFAEDVIVEDDVVAAVEVVADDAALIEDNGDAATVELADNTNSEAYQVDPTTIKFWDKDNGYKVTWTEVPVDSTSSSKSYEMVGETTVLKETAATCTEPAYLWTTAVIDGEVYNSGNTNDPTTAFVTAKALGHDLKEIDRYVIEKPTHYAGGKVHVWYECQRCDYTEDPIIDVPAQEHTLGDEVVEGVSNVKVVDNKPELIDPTKDGLYNVVRYCTTKDGYKEIVKSNVLILAEKGAYAMIVAQEGIADTLVSDKKYYSPTTEFPLDNDSIELEKCTVDGFYTIAYFSSDDKRISEERIRVTAHHMVTNVTVEFKSEHDMGQNTVTYSADGKTYTMYNKSCYLTTYYYEVTHCTAAGCPNEICKAEYVAENPTVGHTNLHFVSRVEKSKTPDGEHLIDTEAKKQVNKLVADGTTYEDLIADTTVAASIKAGFTKVYNDTSTCTKDGTATVDFLCTVCKETIETKTVKVLAKGHIVLPPTRENYVAPTCQAMGSYDAVTYCKRCGEVIREVRDVKIPRIKHSNETSVAVNGQGTDDINDTQSAQKIVFRYVGNVVVDPWDADYVKNAVTEAAVAKKTSNGVDYKEAFVGGGNADKTELGILVTAVSICDYCGEHEVTLNKNFTVALTEAKKQDTAGHAGSIKLTSTYVNDDGKKFTDVRSFPYFSTEEAYEGRVEDTVKNGLVKDNDGVYRYYEAGKVADYTGIVDYAGGKFFVVNGVLAGANGLNLVDQTWYYLSEGQVQRSYTGLALYDKEWFYVVNGKKDANVNGLVPYNGGTFLFAEGRLVKEKSGLWQDADGTWYYLSNGQVQNYTGVAQYDGAFFYVSNGILDTAKNGVVEYDGAKFRVVAGQLYDQVA